MNLTKPNNLFPEEKQEEIKHDIIQKIEDAFSKVTSMNRSEYSITIGGHNSNHNFIYERVCSIYEINGWSRVKLFTSVGTVTFKFYIR